MVLSVCRENTSENTLNERKQRRKQFVFFTKTEDTVINYLHTVEQSLKNLYKGVHSEITVDKMEL